MFGEMRSSAAFAFALVLLASASPTRASMASASPYAAVDARNDGVSFSNLPGHTRGAYAPDHALITPESRVYTSLFGWKETLAAWFITPRHGGRTPILHVPGARDVVRPRPLHSPDATTRARVTSRRRPRVRSPPSRPRRPLPSPPRPPQALMRPGAESGVPSPGAWRFIFVLDGAVTVVGETSDGASASATLATAGTRSSPRTPRTPFDPPTARPSSCTRNRTDRPRARRRRLWARTRPRRRSCSARRRPAHSRDAGRDVRPS